MMNALKQLQKYERLAEFAHKAGLYNCARKWSLKAEKLDAVINALEKVEKEIKMGYAIVKDNEETVWAGEASNLQEALNNALTQSSYKGTLQASWAKDYLRGSVMLALYAPDIAQSFLPAIKINELDRKAWDKVYGAESLEQACKHFLTVPFGKDFYPFEKAIKERMNKISNIQVTLEVETLLLESSKKAVYFFERNKEKYGADYAKKQLKKYVDSGVATLRSTRNPKITTPIKNDLTIIERILNDA